MKVSPQTHQFQVDDRQDDPSKDDHLFVMHSLTTSQCVIRYSDGNFEIQHLNLQNKKSKNVIKPVRTTLAAPVHVPYKTYYKICVQIYILYFTRSYGHYEK